LRFGVEVQQLQALCGQASIRGVSGAQHAVAVAADLGPAEAVPGEEHDVRLLASHEVARSDRDPLASAAVATNSNPKAPMSMTSPSGSAI